MSELKDYDIMDIEAMDDERLEKSESGKIQVTRVYLKSEADKVIAEKDAQILDLIERVQKERAAKVDYKISANDLNDGLKKAYEEINHQKHKRCLAMAEWCQARYDEEDAKVNGCGASWEYISKEMKYWERWQWRWEELAEEPTWAKFLQLIRKEAK